MLGAVASLVLALDGESVAGSNSTGIAVVTAVSIVSGYGLLFALWWFVFREKSRVQRRERRERKG